MFGVHTLKMKGQGTLAGEPEPKPSVFSVLPAQTVHVDLHQWQRRGIPVVCKLNLD